MSSFLNCKKVRVFISSHPERGFPSVEILCEIPVSILPKGHFHIALYFLVPQFFLQSMKSVDPTELSIAFS